MKIYLKSVYIKLHGNYIPLKSCVFKARSLALQIANRGIFNSQIEACSVRKVFLQSHTEVLPSQENEWSGGKVGG